MLAHGDGEADLRLTADGDDVVSVETAVGPNGELPRGSGMAHSAHRLPQEMGGTPSGVGSALAQSGHEYVASAGGDGQQRMIAPPASVVVALGAFLG